MKVDLAPEALCERIEQQLASDGNFAGTIANSALYLNCGRTPDAYADIAELVEPIVREAVREQTEWLMEVVCSDCGGKDGECFHVLSHNWWCPECKTPVMAEYVTFNSQHDPRFGGCGTAVVATPEPFTRAEYLHRKGKKP